jgi:hypothetical protein
VSIMKEQKTEGTAHLNNTQGDHKSLRSFPDGLTRFGLIVIWKSTTRLVTELPPLSVFIGR